MKIKVTNNWENLYWEIGGEDVTAALKKITLELPDKSVETYPVRWERSSKQYYDMGRPYYAEQYNAFITIDFHGMKVKTNLANIAKKVNVIDYKVKRP